ncbi:MAG: DUF3313 family protein [Verrucomicrobiota bacterium]
MRLFVFLPCLLAGGALFGLVSCNSPAAATGFLGETDRMMVKDERYPFQRCYRKPGMDFGDYKKVYVAPVQTKEVKKPSELGETNPRMVAELFETDVALLAADTRREFSESFREDAATERELVVRPEKEEGVLWLEANLVEVIPSRPTLQAAGIFVRGLGFLNQPAIAIEVRLVDSVTREVLFAFADREKAEISLLDTQKFTFYGIQRRELQRWGRQVAEVMAARESEKVDDSFPIKPINW